MRHLFVTQDFGPDLGGIARRHVELCRRFAPERVVVSTVSAGGATEFDSSERYPIVRERFTFGEAKRFVNQVRWAGSLVGLIRDGVDVLHLGNVRPCGYAAWMARQRVDIPFLVYVNGGDVLRELQKTRASAFKRATGRRILSCARGIVANSEWTAGIARTLIAELQLPEEPVVRVIELGTDPQHFRPDRDRGLLRRAFGIGDAPLLLTVARLVPHKGQDVAIEAVGRLAGDMPGLRYLVIGGGDDRGRLEALAAQHGIADRVIFAGTLADDQIAEAYATASVYVGLSRIDRGVNAEGFGISFVEAAASATPSVAGDSGGVRSAVRDGVTGFVVEPSDVDRVTDVLRRLIENEDERRQMGVAARRAVETHYNWDRVARETLVFTQEVTRGAVMGAAT
ncbi:MAG: D-inositol-3-phosphate glycosyltransferase [Gemmatimonadaceae bacterium]|nr:D-inositol-3-phosphate glycosyltransferase [Gemmatimonadaceae bacterium]